MYEGSNHTFFFQFVTRWRWTCEKLKGEFLDHYGGFRKGDIFEQLSDLKQNGFVDE